MSRFIRWFERLARPEYAPDPCKTCDDVSRMIVRVMAAAAPRLALAPDYKERLAPAAAAALDYARSLADELGEPVNLEKGVWDSNPLIPIIATTPEQGLALLRGAAPVRRVLADPAARACHFLLAMQRRESATFGYERQGEVLFRDVLQTAVSFENHRVLAAARTGQEVREAFVEHVLGYLAGLVPAELEQAEQSRNHLRELLEMARSGVRTLELQLRQEEPFSETRRALEATLGGMREQAAGLEAEIAALPLQPAGDADFLELVRKTLQEPGVRLGRERITLRVQDFGVLVREKDSASGRKISFLECAPDSEPAYALFFARLSRENAALVWPGLTPGRGAAGSPTRSSP